MIDLIRCDERLIHGQCMQFIITDNAITRIIVVDDATANNSFLRSIFTNAVPANITANVYTLDEAIAVIEEHKINNVKTLLLMKNPRTLIKLRDNLEDLPNELNIGPQMAKNGIKCTEFATLHPEDIEACKQLTSDGVRVYFNAIGANGKTTEWESVVSKF